MVEESSLQKVIVRTRDGKVIPGFANEDRIKKTLKIINQQGKEETFSMDKLNHQTCVIFLSTMGG